MQKLKLVNKHKGMFPIYNDTNHDGCWANFSAEIIRIRVPTLCILLNQLQLLNLKSWFLSDLKQITIFMYKKYYTEYVLSFVSDGFLSDKNKLYINWKSTYIPLDSFIIIFEKNKVKMRKYNYTVW
jgi:hypothetical protein